MTFSVPTNSGIIETFGISPTGCHMNVAGRPSLTLRTGFVDSGPRPGYGAAPVEGGARRRVPHGTTLVGDLYGEGALVEIGRDLERALGVWRERPPFE